MPAQHVSPRLSLAAKAAELGGAAWRFVGDQVVGHRADGFRIQDIEGVWYVDLTSAQGTTLLGFGHPAVTAALRDVVERGVPRSAGIETGIEVAWHLRETFAAAERVSLHGGAVEARDLAARLARHVTGRTVVLESCAREQALEGPARRLPPGDLLALEAELRGGDVAAVLVEPVVPQVLSQAELKSIGDLARRHGALLVFDESGTAFRLAPAGVQTMVGVAPDLTVLGEALAGGMPFGALLGGAALLDRLAGTGAHPSLGGDTLALAAARATLEVLRREPVAERIRGIGERLRAAFAQGCRQHRIDGSLFGPAGRMDLYFRGQENADGELIRKTYLAELTKLGFLGGPVIYPSPAMDADSVGQAEDALRAALARIRTLLIEHNSFLSGGVPFVFPTSTRALKERGLAVYRYPARADVEVAPVGDHVRISFAAGDLGEVTSSGFYVPTRVRGDFTAHVRYRVRRWQPGGDFACLALFAQDEASARRYYAQRRSGGGASPDDHHVMANLDEHLSETVPVQEPAGEFRLMRRGDHVSAWHGSGDRWTLLGEHVEDGARDVIIGAKIWSSGPCRGLEADLTDLVIDAEIPDDQLEAVPVRPDPRREQLAASG